MVYQLAPMFRKTQVLKSGMDLEYLNSFISLGDIGVLRVL